MPFTLVRECRLSHPEVVFLTDNIVFQQFLRDSSVMYTPHSAITAEAYRISHIAVTFLSPRASVDTRLYEVPWSKTHRQLTPLDTAFRLYHTVNWLYTFLSFDV